MEEDRDYLKVSTSPIHISKEHPYPHIDVYYHFRGERIGEKHGIDIRKLPYYRDERGQTRLKDWIEPGI